MNEFGRASWGGGRPGLPRQERDSEPDYSVFDIKKDHVVVEKETGDLVIVDPT